MKETQYMNKSFVERLMPLENERNLIALKTMQEQLKRQSKLQEVATPPHDITCAPPCDCTQAQAITQILTKPIVSPQYRVYWHRNNKGTLSQKVIDRLLKKHGYTIKQIALYTKTA